MSIGVMLILALALAFAGWKVWKMIQGKNDGGCGGGGSSCSGCSGCPSEAEKEKTK